MPTSVATFPGQHGKARASTRTGDPDTPDGISVGKPGFPSGRRPTRVAGLPRSLTAACDAMKQCSTMAAIFLLKKISFATISLQFAGKARHNCSDGLRHTVGLQGKLTHDVRREFRDCDEIRPHDGGGRCGHDDGRRGRQGAEQRLYLHRNQRPGRFSDSGHGNQRCRTDCVGMDSNGSFLYTNGTYTTLTDPLAAKNATYASGVNNIGQIVGQYYDAGWASHGFTDTNGTFKTIAAPGATLTVANGINNAGQIVGYYIDSLSAYHGFLDTDGTYTDITDPSGSQGNLRGGHQRRRGNRRILHRQPQYLPRLPRHRWHPDDPQRASLWHQQRVANRWTGQQRRLPGHPERDLHRWRAAARNRRHPARRNGSPRMAGAAPCPEAKSIAGLDLKQAGRRRSNHLPDR